MKMASNSILETRSKYSQASDVFQRQLTKIYSNCFRMPSTIFANKSNQLGFIISHYFMFHELKTNSKFYFFTADDKLFDLNNFSAIW